MHEQSVEQERLANEAAVTRAAKELAKLQLADALLTAATGLSSKLYELAPGHTAQGMSATGRQAGYDLAGELLNSLLGNYPLDYQRIIDEANEDNDVINEDAVRQSVAEYVQDITREWRK